MRKIQTLILVSSLLMVACATNQTASLLGKIVIRSVVSEVVSKNNDLGPLFETIGVVLQGANAPTNPDSIKEYIVSNVDIPERHKENVDDVVDNDVDVENNVDSV